MKARPYRKNGSTKDCLFCGESFYQPKCLSRVKYCSPKCYHDSRKGVAMPEKFHDAKVSWIREHREEHIQMLKDRGFKAENNPFWKGLTATYGQKHRWIRSTYGSATKCEACGVDKKVEWSNIDHQYSRDINDYQQLCHKCHSAYDTQVFGWAVRRNCGN